MNGDVADIIKQTFNTNSDENELLDRAREKSFLVFTIDGQEFLSELIDLDDKLKISGFYLYTYFRLSRGTWGQFICYISGCEIGATLNLELNDVSRVLLKYLDRLRLGNVDILISQGHDNAESYFRRLENSHNCLKELAESLISSP